MQIQDVIKRGNLTYHAPLDLNALTAIEVPDDPAAFGSPSAEQMKAQTGGSSPSGRSAGGAPAGLVVRNVQYYVVSPDGEWRPMHTIRRSATTQSAMLGDWGPHAPSVVLASYTPQLPPINNLLSATPCWKDCGGLGVRMSVSNDGLNVIISVVFKLQAPTVVFDISVTKGLWSEVEVTGAAGFDVSVEGTTDQSFQNNVNDIGSLPVDLVLPLSGGGVGFDVHFHQDINLSTAFSAKTSILKAHTSVTMRGSLGFDYHKASSTRDSSTEPTSPVSQMASEASPWGSTRSSSASTSACSLGSGSPASRSVHSSA